MVRLKVPFTLNIAAAYSFQFQYGAIKSILLDFLQDPQKDFNSNMVRLKDKYGVIEAVQRFEFQFQYGAIKSHIYLHIRVGKPISIPIWCD